MKRRDFLATTVATIGATQILSFSARAAGHAPDQFDSSAGPVIVHPVSHASFVMETPQGVIYVDPVGEITDYSPFPDPDLILVTHEHGDHFNLDVLSALMRGNATLVVNPAVSGMLPEGMAHTTLANGEMAEVMGITIDAIPAYNTTEGRENFHPQGRDNGYVLTLGDFRVYISGDTEDIPEMRALENMRVSGLLCMTDPVHA